MQIFPAMQFRLPETSVSRSGVRDDASESAPRLSQLHGLRARLAAFRTDLSRFRETRLVSGVNREGFLPLDALLSAAPLGLNHVPTHATLTSTDPLSWESTSYSPTNPEFQGSSTSNITVTGTYTGNETETLTFFMNRGGTVGSSQLRIDMYDSSGQRLDRVTVGSTTPANTPIQFNNGLVVRFSPGTAQRFDYFTVDVVAGIVNQVNPDGAFNVAGPAGANLGPGTTVTSGTFQINGVGISVNASDSIHSVLDKIAASAAGVTGVFDVANQSVILTSTTPGSAGQINLGSDTSGFLAAMNLVDAQQVDGIDADLDRIISDVSALTQITDGSIYVDGQSFTLTPQTETLRQLMDRMNAANLGVTASYDIEADRFRLTPDSGLTRFTFDDNNRRFASTLQLPTGTFDATPFAMRNRTSTRFLNELEDLTQSLNDLVGSLQDAGLDDVVGRISKALTEVFDAQVPGTPSDAPSRGAFGIRLHRSAGGGELLTIDRNALRGAIRARQQSVFSFLTRESENGDGAGLWEALDEVLADELAQAGEPVETGRQVSFLA